MVGVSVRPLVGGVAAVRPLSIKPLVRSGIGEVAGVGDAVVQGDGDERAVVGGEGGEAVADALVDGLGEFPVAVAFGGVCRRRDRLMRTATSDRTACHQPAGRWRGLRVMASWRHWMSWTLVVRWRAGIRLARR